MKPWMIVAILLVVGIVILCIIGPSLLRNLQKGLRIAMILIVIAVVIAALLYIFRETRIGPGNQTQITDSKKNEEEQEVLEGLGLDDDSDAIVILVHLDDIMVAGQHFSEPEDAARLVAEQTLTASKEVILADDFATAKTYMKVREALSGKGIVFSEKEL